MIRKIREACEFVALGMNWAAHGWAIPDAVEYAIKLAPGGAVTMDGNARNRGEQEARVQRLQKYWPKARLVQRNVYHGEWKETQ